MESCRLPGAADLPVDHRGKAVGRKGGTTSGRSGSPDRTQQRTARLAPVVTRGVICRLDCGAALPRLHRTGRSTRTEVNMARIAAALGVVSALLAGSLFSLSTEYHRYT